MNIGDKILCLRKKDNLSQEQLAEKINVTRQTISKWELNETSPDLKQAKELSKVFNCSLDELVSNDIKDLLVEKVSNTEKLAGIIIKILKVFGILLLVYLLLAFIGILLFTFIKKQPETNYSSSTIDCYIGNNKYEISIGSNDYYNCNNCSKEMNTYLKDITDWANMEHSIENINTYFKENGGYCE